MYVSVLILVVLVDVAVVVVELVGGAEVVVVESVLLKVD